MKIFSFIVFFFAGCIFYGAQLNAATLIVGKNQIFTSIKTALQHCKNGDTILVNAGLYKEQEIVIDKSVVLKGIQQPVLDGESKYQIILIKAPNVVIDGFRLQHSGRSDVNDIAAIKIFHADNVTVSNNTIDDAYWGVLAQYSNNCIITNNRLQAYANESNSGNGIHCWKCDSLRITDNTIKGHRDGIYFEFVTNSIVQKNISENNLRYGLHFMFSHNDAYISNIFKQNGSGVAVMFSHGVKMTGNSFVKNWGDGAYGLLLKEITDSYIYHNRFISNTVGIHAEGTTRIKVEKNVFNSNGWAMRVQASCNDNHILYNNFSNNTFDIATNGSLVLNTFDHNYWDKYEGYDINKDRIGDVPYRPVSLFSMIIEKNPSAMVLFRSFMVTLFDKTEKVLPGITPENLKDNFPLMKPLAL
ncbi:nitrous oxide reductase family maturation protein NosD [Parafilimonas sp.]|uniref:nitrous oxide reductase family maturation protein NosD n=1 Tax=Parafilimonas sp. TaxID=1969739 RepID=UPI003F811839